MQHTVELEPIDIPAYVSSKKKLMLGAVATYVEPVQFHVSEFDVETLESICNQFRRDLFEKAGKPLPGLKARLSYDTHN